MTMDRFAEDFAASTDEQDEEEAHCWVCGEDGHSPTELCMRAEGMI